MYNQRRGWHDYRFLSKSGLLFIKGEKLLVSSYFFKKVPLKLTPSSSERYRY